MRFVQGSAKFVSEVESIALEEVRTDVKTVAKIKIQKTKTIVAEEKCGHSNCTSSSSVNFSIISFYEINFKNNSFDFSSEKSKFYHSKTFISSGFHSIWLIPKIA